MDSVKFPNTQTNEVLDAQAHIWNHVFSYQNSMALKCAIELGIPDTIQKHGKPITLDELANALAIHPTKAPFLHRLMRFLVRSNFFSKTELENGEAVYDLTINSQFLVKNHPHTQAPFTLCMLDPSMIEPAYHLSSWFKNDVETPFHITHGRSIWEHASRASKFNECFNQAMASDARLVGALLVNSNDAKGLFQGIESIVDVAGGDGTMAKGIAEAYPEMKCTVLDLPHVVEGLQASKHNLVYVGGDMFQAVPPSQTVLLKWILHNWSDEDCIKILQRCKEAIPSKDRGGKVIIIDMVIEDQNYTSQHYNVQMLADLQMMCFVTGGKERTEQEWKKLFISAGFIDYKVSSILGSRSFIEVYPS